MIVISFDQGIGTASNFAEAVKYFRMAAFQNMASAQHSLGRCLEKGGPDVEADIDEAVRWYTKAADLKFPAAQDSLGLRAFTLSSHLHDIKQIKACILECSGLCYQEGIGVAVDKAKALKFYALSCEQRHSSAEYHMGICHRDGLGTPKNVAEAIKWLTKAAQQVIELTINLHQIFQKYCL